MFGIGGAEAVKTFLMLVFILVCVAMTALIMFQQGNENGLGGLGGVADTYWSKNKSRSMEGKLVQITTILAVVFFIMTIALNLNF